MQVVITGVSERFSAADLEQGETQIRRRPLGRPLGRSVALAAPIQQETSITEKRRGILEYHGLRSHGTSKYEVVRSEPLRPVLGTPADNDRVLYPHGLTESLDKGALAGLALHQTHTGLWQGDRQRQPWKSGA